MTAEEVLLVIAGAGLELSLAQVNALCVWMDVDSGAEFQLSELELFLGRLGASTKVNSATQAEADTAYKVAEALLVATDLDGDGEPDGAAVSAVWAHLDTDGNGHLSFDEFASGVVRLAEEANIHITREEALVLAKSLDLSKSKSITLVEFVPLLGRIGRGGGRYVGDTGALIQLVRPHLSRPTPYDDPPAPSHRPNPCPSPPGRRPHLRAPARVPHGVQASGHGRGRPPQQRGPHRRPQGP